MLEQPLPIKGIEWIWRYHDVGIWTRSTRFRDKALIKLAEHGYSLE